MTHEHLRKAAVKWLTGSQKCSVVLSEIVTAAMEIPDAVGWRFGSSTMVECKVSRSDLRANRDKCHVRAGRGVGRWRYFLVPEGLVDAEDALLGGCFADYGLLWMYDTGRIKIRREAKPIEPTLRDEVLMLTSALRRIKTREFLTIIQDAAEPEQAEASGSGDAGEGRR